MTGKERACACVRVRGGRGVMAGINNTLILIRGSDMRRATGDGPLGDRAEPILICNRKYGLDFHQILMDAVGRLPHARCPWDRNT